MIYLNNPWKPVRPIIVKDTLICDELSVNGYVIVDLLDDVQLSKLKNLYTTRHNISDNTGGMFYSVYSQDIAYRKEIHTSINEILRPAFENYFRNFRVVMNSFIIKASGPKSEFYVHQDSTGVNEWENTALSLWIPLQDITEVNGAMCLMRGSHRLFSPYRGISIRAPYDRIHSSIKKYLEPIYLKQGKAILFDSRTIHNSLENRSGQNRVVVTSGIFPEKAQLLTCFQESIYSDIEVIAQKDSFLLEYPKFLNGCFDRPYCGETLEVVKNIYPPITADELDQLCQANNILPVNFLNQHSAVDCNMISEPATVLE